VNDKTKPAKGSPIDEDHYNALSEWAESYDFTTDADAVVTRGEGPEPGRAFLVPFMSTAELDTMTRRGRPSMSGAGTSPKRQVRLPADLDAALEERARAEGRKPSAVMREAIENYLKSA
jgi:Ribbon-helix-helix protein, copG family